MTSAPSSSSSASSMSGTPTRWTPDKDKAAAVLEMVRCLAGGVPEELTRAYQMHERMMQDSSELAVYLAALSLDRTTDQTLRVRACVLMSQAAVSGWSGMLDKRLRSVFKSMVLSGLSECPLSEIRRQCASVISAVVRDTGLLTDWPSLVGDLVSRLQDRKELDSPKDIGTTASILQCLVYLSGDCAGQLSADSSNITGLVSALLHLSVTPLRSSLSSRRSSEETWKILSQISTLSLQCLRHLYRVQCSALVSSRMADFCQVLAELANSRSNLSVSVCHACMDCIISVMNERYVELKSAKVSPSSSEIGGSISTSNIESILFDFAEHCCRSEGSSEADALAMAGFDFVNVFVTDAHNKDKDASVIGRRIKGITLLTMDRMVYTKEILATIDLRRDDCSKHRTDDGRDTEARFYRTRDEMIRKGATSTAATSDHDGDADEDDEDDMDKELTEWNVRKAAARLLDSMVWRSELRTDCLNVAVPLIQERLQSEKELIRESALLALTAICSHGLDFITGHLPRIVPSLLLQCKDESVLVSTVAVHCLGKFAQWYISSKETKQLFGRVLECLADCMIRPSRRVQLSSCATLHSLLTDPSNCADEMGLYRSVLFDRFARCLGLYGSSTLGQLVDVIALCVVQWSNTESGSEELLNMHKDESLMCRILDPLLKRWSMADDCSSVVFPIIEALVQIISVGVGSTEWFQRRLMKEVLFHSLSLCQTIQQMCRDFDEALEELAKAFGDVSEEHWPEDWMDDVEVERPDLSFWVSGLDLASTLCECCQPSFDESLMRDEDGSIRAKVIQVVWHSLFSDNGEVRRNGLAFLGDLIAHCSKAMESEVPALMEEVIKELTPEQDSRVRSDGYISLNASWCIGVALNQYGPRMSAIGEPCLRGLVSALRDAHTPGFVAVHLAITLSRLAQVFPAQVSLAWPQFAHQWTLALAQRQVDSDQERAVRTLCALVQRNPEPLLSEEDAIRAFLRCTSVFQSDESVSRTLHFIRSRLGSEAWSRLISDIKGI